MIRFVNVEPKNYSPEAKKILISAGEYYEDFFTREALIDAIPAYDVLITRLGFKIDRQVIDASKKLKVVVTATTGLDHIDTEYAKSSGITILSLKGEYGFLRSIPATAELTWGLLLALIRNIPQAYKAICEGEWDRDKYRGHDLCGKRLGIVGLGRIGEKIAMYGTVFGMQVFAYDPYRSSWPKQVIKVNTLDDLLQVSNVVSLHVPLNEQTKGMIGIREIAQLPNGSILINTARGDILNSQALLMALNQGKLAGAALDVIPGELGGESQERHNLISYACCHTNLLLTPHIGGATVESMWRTEVFMAQKLVDWLREHP